MKIKLLKSAANLALMAIFASAALAADAPKSACPACSTCPGGAPKADGILQKMSATLGGAQEFSFAAHRQIAPALIAGRDLPADAHVTITVRRPNKLVAKSTSSGDVRHFYFDGRNVTMYDGKKNLYATVPMRASLDGLVAELDEKYGFTPPLAELALSNVYEDVHWKAKSVSYVGEGQVRGGFLGLETVTCHRLALSGKVLDAELWVGVADHLPRKLVAAAKSGAGQPVVKVEFSDWDLAAKAVDRDFTFVPPAGATKVPMRTTAEMKAKQKKN
jgi:hypothetical protein